MYMYINVYKCIYIYIYTSICLNPQEVILSKWLLEGPTHAVFFKFRLLACGCSGITSFLEIVFFFALLSSKMCRASFNLFHFSFGFKMSKVSFQHASFTFNILHFSFTMLLFSFKLLHFSFIMLRLSFKMLHFELPNLTKNGVSSIPTQKNISAGFPPSNFLEFWPSKQKGTA